MPFDETLLPASSAGPTLRLEVLGCGHIVSFKNTKMILPGKYVPDPGSKGGIRQVRPPLLITEPRKQALLKNYEAAIERALLSAYQTAVAGMQTAPSLQSWIQSSVFLDDSVDWIPESEGYAVETVPPGEEGIVVFITPLGDRPA